MERTAADRRPGMEVPVQKPERPPRFEHLSRTGRRRDSLLNRYPAAFAALLAVTVLYALDACFFDSTYASAARGVFQQVHHAFHY
jgi:hypothetical protein